MRTVKITLVALTIVMVAACSSDGGDGASTEVNDEAKPYVEGLAKNLVDPDEAGLEPEQADCLAAKWVNTATPERLERADANPDELTGSTNDFDDVGLSREEATSMVDGWEQCDIDLRATIVEAGLQGEEYSDEERKCLNDALDIEIVKEGFISSWSESESEPADDAKAEEMFEKQAACTSAISG